MARDIIQNAVRDVARQCSREAKILDEAWLKTADSRAVQGGAVCEQAQSWYATSRKLNALANELMSDEFDD